MKNSIDYGNGLANVDANGIRYSVVSQNSLNYYAMDDVFQLRKDLTYNEGLKDLKKRFIETVYEFLNDNDLLNYDEAKNLSDDDLIRLFELDSVLDSIEERFSEGYESDGSESWLYESDVTLTDCLDSDVMVLKSGYVTLAPLCSPCVPGAGNLNDAIEEWSINPKEFFDYSSYANYCYALNSDWFMDNNENDYLPYPILSVENFLAGNTEEEFWTIPENNA